MKTIWLRSESKDNERRSPLTPQNAKKLLKKGAHVVVEQCPHRIFDIKEYRSIGCEVAPRFSWKQAPHDAYIFALKELPEESDSLIHKHIYFAHAFKGQNGAQELLSRFKAGEGELLDLEYLVDENQRRVAAFGYWAGYVGMAMILRCYFKKLLGNSYELQSYNNKELLLEELKELKEATELSPKIIIIGAKGRCGTGSSDLAKQLNLSPTLWDYEETRKGGPFQEITEHDIFVNTALITKKIPPFINKDLVQERINLKYIADISCDPTSDLNPIPLYNDITSWENPLVNVNDSLEIMAVDNLPSVLPRESSEDFSNQLLPHLIQLIESNGEASVWKNAKKIFRQHCH